ncbi:hypothetical protein [Brevibacillus centrosporus]|uniref:DUF3846 domain-containing protein n=1 Tax=Brevibacillus centrosporus TaxID=54910 RepID=UPI002E23CDC4|nr:DUF3846 domain-containing protein [Brevibacillus centrosporus]
MIHVYVKRPHEAAFSYEVNGQDELQELVGGEIEVVVDDSLAGISLVVNEDARGVEANNFPVTSEGYLDWVYGTCVFVKKDGQSLSDEDLLRINQFLTAKV